MTPNGVIFLFFSFHKSCQKVQMLYCHTASCFKVPVQPEQQQCDIERARQMVHEQMQPIRDSKWIVLSCETCLSHFSMASGPLHIGQDKFCQAAHYK